MAFELITVVAGGRPFAGWTSVTINAGFGEAARSFSISVTEVGSFPEIQPWHFPPSTPVQVLASGDLLVDGYVDEYMPAGDATSHSVTLNGRGRGADIVDSSPHHQTGLFENKSIEQIARDLDRFGVGIRASARAAAAAAELVPWFQLRRGSTVWAEIMRLLPQRGLTLTGLADGTIEIQRGPQGRHAGGLVQGENILSIAARLSDAERFSEYGVIGQGDGEEDEDFEAFGETADGSVPRFRYNETVDFDVTSNRLAQGFSDWKKARAAGLGREATVVAPGFRDGGGQLWEPNRLVFLHSPWAKIDQDMAINGVTFRQDDASGTTTTLVLVDARAQGGGGPAGGGSGPPFEVFSR